MQPPNPEQPYPYQPTQPHYNPRQTPVPPPPYQYGAYPPQQPIKPRKSKTWLWIIGLILAFLVGRASVTASSTTATPQTSTASTANQQAAQPTEAPTKPLTWQTVQTFSGNGNQKTAVFAVSDDWKLAWECTPDPSANAIGGYYFSVNVDNSDSSISDFGALSGNCKPGNISTATNEHQAGNVFLDVTSGGGPWTVTVQEMK